LPAEVEDPTPKAEELRKSTEAIIKAKLPHLFAALEAKRRSEQEAEKTVPSRNSLKDKTLSFSDSSQSSKKRELGQKVTLKEFKEGEFLSTSLL
jgi:hypothetical protein